MNHEDCVRYGYRDIPCEGEVYKAESLAGTGTLIAMCEAHHAKAERVAQEAAEMVAEAEWSEYEIAMGWDN